MQELLAVVQESGAGFVSGKGVGPAYHSTNRPLFHSRIAPFALHHGAGIDDVIPVLCHPVSSLPSSTQEDERKTRPPVHFHVTGYTSVCRIQR